MGIVFANLIFILTLAIFASYFILGIISAISLRRYLRKSSYINYDTLMLSPMLPKISIIAPAFNESKSIVDSINTLLSIYYNNFEVIIVNDGSSDETFPKMLEAFELVKVNFYFDYQIPCQQIKGVYKSANPSYYRLVVIDKENGGKADSLNAGINLSSSSRIVIIDADSIIESDSVIKLIKPFLEEKEHKVIGTGGVIRIVNSCKIERGHLGEIRLPQRLLPRLQVIEYTRAFLLGRIAWSRLDGLMLISGAMGMFDRETVIKAGGYSTRTVGEDMELVLRMRRYKAERDEKYELTYIPDPLCWTEAPSDIKSMLKQRSRWTRGMIESLWTHRRIFLNPKYKKLGLLGYPYWLLFEWLAPLIAFTGIVYSIYMLITGNLNLSFFLLLYLFVYTIAVSLSMWAILFEEITFHKYEREKDLLRLIAASFAEPFFYPMHAVFAVTGNLEVLFGKKGWGKAARNGFNK